MNRNSLFANKSQLLISRQDQLTGDHHIQTSYPSHQHQPPAPNNQHTMSTGSKARLGLKQSAPNTSLLLFHLILLAHSSLLAQAWRHYDTTNDNRLQLFGNLQAPQASSQFLVASTGFSNQLGGQQHAANKQSAQPEPANKLQDSSSSPHDVQGSNVSPAKASAEPQAKAPVSVLSTVLPSIAGKIMDSSAPDGADKSAASIQFLKPRKDAADKKQVEHAQQQIISQHARAHHNHYQHHHQSSEPTKQRDHKIVSSALDASASLDRRESALFSLLDSLKTGISNRNSIVKAISDNKLARTISTVSKSISGNKYFAGAAAASALAALGLTVSKLFNPYSIANGFSKISDPMLSSASIMSPSIAGVMAPTDERNFLYTNPSDSMLQAPSSGSFRNQLYYPYNDFSSSFDSSHRGASNQAYYPTSPAYPNDQVYVSYSPKPAPKSNAKLQSETTGYYSGFYDNSDLSNRPAPYDPYMSATEAQDANLPGRYPSANNYNQPLITDQMSSSGSLESLSYANHRGDAQYQQPTDGSPKYAYMPTSYPNSSPRRSSSVSLKMDDATRARLFEHLKKLYQQQQLAQAASQTVGSSGELAGTDYFADKSPLLTSSIPLVPMTTTTTTTTTNADTEYLVQPSIKSTLLAPKSTLNSNVYGYHHAPSEPTSQQGQPSGRQYMIIRPRTNVPDLSPPTASPSNGYNLDNSQQSSGPWRSAEPELDSTAEPETSWRSLDGSGGAGGGSSQQAKARSKQTLDDQQVSSAQSNSSKARSVNGQPELLHRVSRTPNHSSVKESARHPIETMTDYDSHQDTLNGASNAAAAPLKSTEASHDSKQRQNVSTMIAHNHRQSNFTEDATNDTHTNSAESKLALDQHHHAELARSSSDKLRPPPTGDQTEEEAKQQLDIPLNSSGSR